MAGTSSASSTNGMGPTLPDWLDNTSENGQMTILLMKAVDGSLPNNPFVTEKSITNKAGKVTDAYMNRDGALVIKTRSSRQANTLLKMTQLIDGTKVLIQKHPILNRTKIFVHCADTIKMTDEELETGLREKYANFFEVRRFKKLVNSQSVNTPNMVITFDGTVAPTEVKIGYAKCNTHPFLPNPMQCFKCYRFGHTKMRCTQPAVCRNCSQEHEMILDEQNRQICSIAAYCRNCNGNHQLASRNCPLFKEDEFVILIRSEEGVSPGEAMRRAKQRMKEQSNRGTFAEVAAQSTELDQLRGELRNMQIAIAKNQVALTELEAVKTQAATTAAELQNVKKELGSAQRSNMELAAEN